MEFWGVEVKAGETVSVPVEDGHLIHVSQVALGDVKNPKAANYVPVRMKVEDKKFVIGTLSADKGPQISFDLVLDKDFELSHDWKDGSIYFCGYTAEQDDGSDGPEGFYDEEDVSSDEEELVLENGKPIPADKATDSKAAASKPATSAKPKVTVVEPKKDESDDSDDSDEESEDDLLDESDDDDMSEDEETPVKVEPPSKKRPSSAVKTPVSTKKAKTETPQKTDGKKGSVHTATPHPSKKSEKKTAESPKSIGVSCKTCSKTFNTEKGLESHTKAKHGGK